MARQEFTRTTKLKAWDRAKGRCENCERKLFPGDRVEYDHRIPCALGGDNSLGNCQVLCGWCHGEKTAKSDAPTIAKSRSVRARHVGAKTPKRKGNGFGPKHLKKKVTGEVVPRDD